jgi:hypothetical protein
VLMYDASHQLLDYWRDEKCLQVVVQPKLKTAVEISKGSILELILKKSYSRLWSAFFWFKTVVTVGSVMTRRLP